MKLSVVVSAYDNWRALDFTLQGFRCQSSAPDELIVAEDSEFAEVAAVVARHAALAPFALHHVRHPDAGFRKCLILNKAIAQAAGDFIVFTDADCVPRADFISAYRQLARAGRFLAGGSHVDLPAEFHEGRLVPQWIDDQRLFDPAFLASHGVRTPWARLMQPGPLARMLDLLTARNAFIGNNSGAWKTDLMRVGGFDEAMGYGAEDSNLGIRLNHAGVRGVRARHSLVCVHLGHPRSYRHEDEIARNKAWNRQLAASRAVLPRQSILLERDTA